MKEMLQNQQGSLLASWYRDSFSSELNRLLDTFEFKIEPAEERGLRYRFVLRLKKESDRQSELCDRIGCLLVNEIDDLQETEIDQIIVWSPVESTCVWRRRRR